MDRPNPILQGACHCGKIQAQASLGSPSTELRPRQCTCSFCTKHGAAYFSDPNGSVTYNLAESAKPIYYSQYEGALAKFLLCGDCGVLVGVFYTSATNQQFSALNSRVFADADFGPSVLASPDVLSKSEKIARWEKLWFQNLRIIEANDSKGE